MHGLRNETDSQNTKESLDGVTCKLDPPIVSSAYNKIDSVDDKFEYNQDIIHPGISIETLNAKSNTTEKKSEELKEQGSNEIGSAKKGIKRNVLKISPETLPCPRETKITTEIPPYVIDPVIPVQNEMKTYRFQGINSSHKLLLEFIVVLWSVCLFFFT